MKIKKQIKFSKLKPATPKQIAQIEQLEQLIYVYAKKTNQPYILGLTIAVTTMAYSFFLIRENALFHAQYLKLLDYFFSNFSPENAGVNQLKILLQVSIDKVQRYCLDYYDEAKQLSNVLSSDIETVLTLKYGDPGINTIRTNCMSFCQRFIDYFVKNHESTTDAAEIMTGFQTDLRELKLEQLFQAVDNLLSYVNNMVDTVRAQEMSYTRLLTLEKQKNVNLTKIIWIFATKRWIISPLVNRIFPFGIHLLSKPKLSQKKALLSEQQAELYLDQLKAYTNDLEHVVHRNTKLLHFSVMVLALLAFIVLLANGFLDLPGELAFFLMAVTVSDFYHGISYLKNTVDTYYLDSRIQAIKNNLNDFLGEIFIIDFTRSPLLESVQFNFYYLNHKNLHPEDMMIMLSRCLKNYPIKLISKNSLQVVVSHCNVLTKAALSKIRMQIDTGMERLYQINLLTKQLKNIQKNIFPDILAENSDFTCDKYFDNQGIPYANWYLYSKTREQALHLQNKLGITNCFFQEILENKIVLTISYSESLKNIDLTEFIQLKPKSASILDSRFFMEQRSSDKKSKKSKTEKQSFSEWHDERIEGKKLSFSHITSLVIKKLPPPYENARRIKAPFLSANSHIWAIFSAKKEDFPSEECFKKFKELFKEPTIVPSKERQGLVHDPAHSSPNDQHFKAKLLGEFGAFRIRDEVFKVLMGNHLETVHNFTKLVLEHS